MSQTANINVPFRITASESDQHPGLTFCYVDHPLISESVYANLSKAREVLRKRVAEDVERGLRACKHTRRAYVFCADLTVLAVHWSANVDGWCYEIAGPQRSHTCSASGFDSIDAALDAARRHAGNYGGIVSEC